jgi:two-component system, NarL family, nitrate/nitrite response regulator NarL
MERNDMREERPSGERAAAAGDLPVGIVSGVRLYREGLTATLARQLGLPVSWAVAGVEDAVARVAQGVARVVVVDVATRDSLAIVRAMRRIAPDVPIIAFAAHDMDGEILACAEAGVAGFVPCDASIDDLIAAIRCAERGEVRCTPRAAAVVFRRVASLAAVAPESHVALTARERVILELVDDGLSNKDIARRLNIQVTTVKNHVHKLLEKMHVKTRAEAAARHRAGAPPRSLR